MAAAAGQAAGLAVGAAVGSILGPGGAAAGASIGSSVVGFLEETSANKTQGILDDAALRLNQEQARLKASEASSIHARNFRKALASQVSLASMRGGAGSLVTQFGSESFQNFLQDQKAIETGLKVSEAQGAIGEATNAANQVARESRAISRLAGNVAEGINLNLLKPGQ